jgi:uncharacterized protein
MKKIYLREITDQDTELSFTQEEKWVADAVARVDEKIEGLAAKPPVSSEARPVKTEMTIRKVDEVVVITGRIDTGLQLVCSRCAAYYEHETHPQFTALFCKDPSMAGVAHLDEAEGGPVGRNHGFARHAHDEDSDGDESDAGQNLDITYISEDFIDLAAVVTEQLQLQVPFQPLCSQECKGICFQCGADLNAGRCACSKLAKLTPFSVLKDFKAQRS